MEVNAELFNDALNFDLEDGIEDDPKVDALINQVEKEMHQQREIEKPQ